MYTRLFFTAGLLALGALLGGCASSNPYAGMSADQLFEAGAQAFAEDDWDEAVKLFERLIFAEPTHPRMVEARMYLARAYFNRDDYITSASEFNRILDRHPGHQMAPDAALGICKSYVELSPHVQRDQAYTVQAMAACDNVVQDFGAFEAAVEARELRERMRYKLARKELVAGEFYFKRKMYDSGIIFFNDLLTLYPETPQAAQALLYLYRSYMAINWEAEAEQAKERLLRDFPDSEAAAELLANGGGG